MRRWLVLGGAVFLVLFIVGVFFYTTVYRMPVSRVTNFFQKLADKADKVGQSQEEKNEQKKETMRHNITEAINQGLTFIGKGQQQDGSFIFYDCTDSEKQSCNKFTSSGITAAITLMINILEDKRAEEITSHAISYVKKDSKIISEGNKSHSAWKIISENPQNIPMPLSLKDTAIISILLLQNKVSFPSDITVLDKYKNSMGLYYSWADNKANKVDQQKYSELGEKYAGIDCITNAYMLSYLSLKNIESTDICQYITNVIEKKLYPACMAGNTETAGFFVPVASTRPACVQDSLFLITEELKTYQYKNLFGEILGTFALVELGYDDPEMEKKIASILNSQLSDGGFPDVSVDPGNDYHYVQSRELVTAAALRTLAAYSRR